jgi:hypothetical protein
MAEGFFEKSEYLLVFWIGKIAFRVRKVMFPQPPRRI